MSTAERLGFENTGVTGSEDIANVCAEWHGRQIKYLEQLLRQGLILNANDYFEKKRLDLAKRAPLAYCTLLYN